MKTIVFTPRKGGREGGREELMASMQVRSLFDTLPGGGGGGGGGGAAVVVGTIKQKAMEEEGAENVSRIMGGSEGGGVGSTAQLMRSPSMLMMSKEGGRAGGRE